MGITNVILKGVLDMVFYFTATGNSLYIVKQLHNDPVSIAQVKGSNVFTDETIGIVCPVYCGKIPHIVSEFIKRSKFETKYLFMILTYGMSPSDSAQYTSEWCRKHGVNTDYIACIKMVDNYLPGFDMNAEKKLDKNISGQLKSIISDIKNRKRSIEKAAVNEKMQRRTVAFMNRIFPSMNNGNALRITERCTGCRVCEQVCPIGNLEVRSGKAVRIHKTCEFCLACIQNCPHNAISLRSERNPQARFRNENISLDEIIRSNRQ